MPTFSKASREKLMGVHPDLRTIFTEVIKHRDCTVVSGLRTQEEQQALYAKGRTQPGNIVTHKDGIERRSRHQDGMAVDVVPYFAEEPHIRWDDIEAFKNFGSFVKGVAAILQDCGVIAHRLEWGGEWNWKDYPHYEL